MKVTITEAGIAFEDSPPIELEGIDEAGRQALATLHAFTWALGRIVEEFGMFGVRGDAQQAIQTAMGKD